MKKWILIFVLILSNQIMAQDAKEIIKESQNAIDIGAMQMDVTLKIYDTRGRERIRKLTTSTGIFGEVTKTLLRFQEPADVKGTSLLIYDYDNQADDMWIYLPALRKNRRVVSSERGSSFMGSEFSNADMSVPAANDFEYKLLADESLDGKLCWKIETRCKSEDIEDDYGYHRKMCWIDKETFLCHKVEFYDLDNELFKVQLIRDYRKQGNGSYFAFEMEMRNCKNDRKSLMIVDKLVSGVKMNESNFSPSKLSKS